MSRVARLGLIVTAALLLLPPAAGAGVHVVATPYDVSTQATPLALHATTGDFDGDGRIDVAVSDLGMGGGDVTILFGRGDGTFEDGGVYDTDPPDSITAGDFDGDGYDDVALASRSAGTLTVLYGNADATLDAVTIALAPQVSSVAAGHFDADPNLDLVAATPGAVLVLLGDGSGGFAAPVSYGTGGGVVAAGDFDGDGRDDVAASPAGQGFGVLLSNPDGTLQAARSAPLPPGVGPSALAVGRLNADARPDIVLSPAGAVSLTGADGTPGAPVVAISGGAIAAAIGDLDGDGKADLVAGTQLFTSFGSVRLLTGRGDGTFDAPVTLAVPEHAWPAAVADFNRDGFPDVVLTDGESESAAVGLSSPWIKADHQDLGWGTVRVGAVGEPKALTIANDGRPPLAIARVALAGASPGEFRIAGDGCSGRTLAAGATCAVSVTSAPTAAGARTAELVVSGNAPEARFGLIGSGVVPNPGPVLDRQAPGVVLKLASQRLGAVLKRGLAVTLSCSEPCTLRAQLRRASSVVASKTLRLTAGKKAKLTLKLSKRARRSLAHARRAKLTLRVRATDASANSATTSRSLTLRR